MINLARWLRHFPRRKPARRSPGQVGVVGRPVPVPARRPNPNLANPIYEGGARRFYEDKMLRPRGDYDDKGAA